jgi:hypothetical protein
MHHISKKKSKKFRVTTESISAAKGRTKSPRARLRSSEQEASWTHERSDARQAKDVLQQQ